MWYLRFVIWKLRVKKLCLKSCFLNGNLRIWMMYNFFSKYNEKIYKVTIRNYKKL